MSFRLIASHVISKQPFVYEMKVFGNYITDLTIPAQDIQNDIDISYCLHAKLHTELQTCYRMYRCNSFNLFMTLCSAIWLVAASQKSLILMIREGWHCVVLCLSTKDNYHTWVSYLSFHLKICSRIVSNVGKFTYAHRTKIEKTI